MKKIHEDLALETDGVVVAVEGHVTGRPVGLRLGLAEDDDDRVESNTAASPFVKPIPLGEGGGGALLKRGTRGGYGGKCHT